MFKDHKKMTTAKARRSVRGQLGTALLGLALACIALGAQHAGGERFVPPSVTVGGDILYPFEVVASGLVTLSVTLNSDGRPPSEWAEGRDIEGLTPLVSSVVTHWTYSPGMLEGDTTPSTINIEVVFNPADTLAEKLRVPPLASTLALLPRGYVPPDVVAGSYASYPVNSVASGTVVLDVTVDNNGRFKKIGVIRDVPSLTPGAIAAVRGWTIKPATLLSKAITSKLIVAFVFRPPNISKS
jgi:hypothetical protein